MARRSYPSRGQTAAWRAALRKAAMAVETRGPHKGRKLVDLVAERLVDLALHGEGPAALAAIRELGDRLDGKAAGTSRPGSSTPGARRSPPSRPRADRSRIVRPVDVPRPYAGDPKVARCARRPRADGVRRSCARETEPVPRSQPCTFVSLARRETILGA